MSIFGLFKGFKKRLEETARDINILHGKILQFNERLNKSYSISGDSEKKRLEKEFRKLLAEYWALNKNINRLRKEADKSNEEQERLFMKQIESKFKDLLFSKKPDISSLDEYFKTFF